MENSSNLKIALVVVISYYRYITGRQSVSMSWSHISHAISWGIILSPSAIFVGGGMQVVEASLNRLAPESLCSILGVVTAKHRSLASPHHYFYCYYIVTCTRYFYNENVKQTQQTTTDLMATTTRWGNPKEKID